jgi:hypothetical protein
MFDRVFPTSSVIGVLVLGAVGFFLGLAVGDRRKRWLMEAPPAAAPPPGKHAPPVPPQLPEKDAAAQAKMWSRAIEGGICALLGAVLARLVFGICLDAVHAFEPAATPAVANKVTNASFTLLWAGVPILGLIDTIPYLKDSVIFSKPDVLIWIVMGIGGLTGGVNGACRIYKWVGLGCLEFLLDVTWGLAGSGLGFLLLLFNAIGQYTYRYDDRTGAHRYDPGLHVFDDYAFTLGAVISQMDKAADPALYDHELLHVRVHTRVFGPFFQFTYALWAAVFFFLGIIVALIKRKSVGKGIFTYSYLNNPWEYWAYKVGGKRNAGAVEASMLWDGALMIGWAIGFYLVVALLTLWIVLGVWG